MSADFDREIERAVHEMLDVEPRADARARVLARIEQRAPSARWLWVAAPVAAAALVILAIVLRPAPPTRSGGESGAPVARVEQPRVPPEGGDLPPEGGYLPPEGGSHGGGSHGGGSHGGGSHGGEPAWLPASAGSTASGGSPAVEIAPLAAPAPIKVALGEPRPIEQPEVRIAALPAITPIAIEPLPEGGRH